jgi:signal transduction histidine kinase
MRQGFTTWLAKGRFSSLSIPVAISTAVLLIAITEASYQAQSNALNQLIVQGQARLQLLHAFQRLSAAESGKRGYLLIQDKIYLQPYMQAAQDVVHDLNQIDSLDVQFDDPAVLSAQKQIRESMQVKLSEMREVLRLHDAGNHEAAMDMVRSGIGREMMQQLDGEVNRLMKYRNAHIAEGLQEVKDVFLLGRIGVIAMTTLSTIILIAFIVANRRFTQESELQRAALQAERDRLEQEVSDRMADLKELTLHLQSAREDERARLARELHDELGALLTSAKLNVTFMKPKVSKGLPELMPKLTQLVESLNAGIALKRRIIEDLTPSALRTLGLVPALEILCSERAQGCEIDIVHQLVKVPLDADRQLTVYRFVQEALTNMAKYAGAQRATVRMSVADGDVRIEVWDNGQGFDASKLPTGSHGLRGMRFRMEALGGRMTIASSATEGTRLMAWLPLVDASAS